MNGKIRAASIIAIALMLSACDASKQESKQQEQEQSSASVVKTEQAEVLPYLNIQEQEAKVALPFCETKNCIDLSIQTVHTEDAWLNDWIAKSQAKVIQDQIGLKQDMSLQQAINAYVKKSDVWQAEFSKNKPYELAMYTRIAYQRNQYVLMQLGVDTKQEEVKVKERYYFFVADRKKQKAVTLLDILEPKQQTVMNDIVQQAYQKWLKQQKAEVKQKAPKKLYWGQADWFFDQEGIGLHYRTHEIVKDGAQLDIYLTKAQTQQILKADAYQHMF
ncbi:hypothetical protein B9T26_02855 [Acinetobacter sp. ANC 4169]|uniref:hypothetical protein n=1 Tax=Acinetobacter sp. ANC 4169 TaxID=1977879 RepID=UPI000A32BEEC|nr:hypothetical protein [Acinetobacter sp. ANC 4169]OTG76049.1 hypothetical protein B9T26_02855 [Acinetobacter sp. ANC 4169]